jgi:hypothetical protein
MFSGRAWHPRRLVYSKDMILFALPGSTHVIDAIPLFEVTEIAYMNDEGKGDENISPGKIKRGSSKSLIVTEDESPPEKKPPDAKGKRSGDSNKVKFRNSLQIHTKADGYNSGRQYIIKVGSDAERKTMIEELRKLSKIATDKFLAKSEFAKSQASIVPPPAVPCSPVLPTRPRDTTHRVRHTPRRCVAGVGGGG